MRTGSTQDLLPASLLTAAGPEDSVELSIVVDTIAGGGERLSRQVEVAVAVETLVEQGIVQREMCDGTERLSLTDEGRVIAAETVERLSERRVELVEGDQRRELTIAEAAAELDRSPVEIAVDCSADGVYYAEDRVKGDDIVGREAERAEFEAVLDRVRASDDGEVVRLVGPVGNGKTVLGDAVLAATPADVETVRVTSREAESEPFQPLRDAFTQAGVENPIEATEFDVDDAETFEAEQTGLFTNITRVLTPDSGTRVLVFDDVNRADRATWEYLADLSEQLADRPLVMVLSHRPGTIPEDAPVHPEANLGETLIELTGLDWDGTKQLIQQVVGRRSVPDTFVDAVQERTGGTPLFVETAVETLLETNQIDPQLGRYPTEPGEFDLPAEVTETIQRQTEALEGEVRAVLEWVAVASGYVPVSLVEQAAEDAPERVGTVLDTVTGTGLLDRETRDGERVVTFRNEVFGDALADRLDDTEREQRHETIARLLEDRAGKRDDPDQQAAADRAATVAYHYEQSGDLTSGVEWYETAANRATDVYAHETAITYYYRVIDLARQAHDTETVLAANEELAEIYLVTGEYSEAEKHVQFVRERVDWDDSSRNQRLARLRGQIHNAQSEFNEAVEVATAALNGDDNHEQCRLLDVVAEARYELSNFEKMRETAQRQRELADRIDEHSFEADALKRLGTVAYVRGSYDEARAFYEQSLAVAEENGDRRRNDILNNLGAVASKQSRYDQAREFYEQSLAIEREIGDRGAEAGSLNNLAYLAEVEGRYDQAREFYEQSRAIGEEIGDRTMIIMSLLNLGSVAHRQGRYDQAREYCTECLANCREIGNRRLQAHSLVKLGIVAHRQGRYDRAREHHETSLEITREIGAVRRQCISLNALGNLVCRCGDDDRAREYYEEALELAVEQETTDEEAKSHCGLCKLARTADDYDRARDQFERALTLSEADGDPFYIGQVRLEGANLALARGDIATARERAETARETFETIGASYWQGRGRYVLGAIEHADGDAVAAREHYAAAADTFEEVGAVPDTLETLELLVETCRDHGDDEAAERWSQRARDVLADAPDEVANEHGQWVGTRPEKSGKS